MPLLKPVLPTADLPLPGRDKWNKFSSSLNLSAECGSNCWDIVFAMAPVWSFCTDSWNMFETLAIMQSSQLQMCRC